MSKICQGQNARQARKLDGWDSAIADAKRRIRELQFSLKVFKQHKKAGEQWPSATRN